MNTLYEYQGVTYGWWGHKNGYTAYKQIDYMYDPQIPRKEIVVEEATDTVVSTDIATYWGTI